MGQRYIGPPAGFRKPLSSGMGLGVPVPVAYMNPSAEAITWRVSISPLALLAGRGLSIRGVHDGRR